MPVTLATRTNRGARDTHPQRIGESATSRAHGPTFNQLSRRGTRGLHISNDSQVAPFSGANAANLKKRFQHYSISAQGCIARALQEDSIRVHLGAKNEATAPELVVLGDALLRGFQLNRDLFFQSNTFRDPVFNPSGRAFPVDILKVYGGDQWYEPVDGVHFHQTDTERFKDVLRNNALTGSGGQLVVILDTVCQSREQLQAFLFSKGAP